MRKKTLAWYNFIPHLAKSEDDITRETHRGEGAKRRETEYGGEEAEHGGAKRG